MMSSSRSTSPNPLSAGFLLLQGLDDSLRDARSMCRNSNAITTPTVDIWSFGPLDSLHNGDEWSSNAGDLSDGDSIAASVVADSLSTCVSNNGIAEWNPSELLQHAVDDDLLRVWDGLSRLLSESLSVFTVAWAEFQHLFDARLDIDSYSG